MKENEGKHIDKLIDKVMKESSLESPSVDFTALVMGKVEAIQTSTYTTYEPLISKRVWVLLSIGFLVLVGMIARFGKIESSIWFDNFDFLNTNRFLELINGIQVSQTTLVSISIFALMLLVQIPLLKNYFDKRFQF